MRMKTTCAATEIAKAVRRTERDARPRRRGPVRSRCGSWAPACEFMVLPNPAGGGCSSNEAAQAASSLGQPVLPYRERDTEETLSSRP